MKFNHKKVFDGFKAAFSPVMTQGQVNGLEFLITSFERDGIWSDVRYIAYALATIFHETAYTFQPIQEYGSAAYFERRYGHQTRKGRELGNDAPGEGAKYSGKGYVQLTGESNYEKLEKIIREQNPQAVANFEARTGQRFDLTDFANQAKDPQVAFLIMTIGMFRGIYTGKRFSDYINDDDTNYYEARRIINGTDKASTISGYAQKFEKILRSASESSPLADLSDDEQDDLLEFPANEPVSNTALNDLADSSNLPLSDPPPVQSPEQPAKPEAPVEVAQVKPEIEPSESLADKVEQSASKVKAWYVALPSAVLTAIGGFWERITSGETSLVYWLVGASALIATIYFVASFWLKNQREKRAAEEKREETALRLKREEQAHELQLKTLESAMRQDLNTVRIVPMPVENSEA